jgi:hypothetical protein
MTDLSPAAQAVLDAANYVYDRAGTTGHGLAAALRAAAYIVAPAIPVCDHCCDRQSQNIRHKLLAIADELEGQ